MDSFEWNKIFGAVLGTVLLVATLNIVVGKMMAPHQSGKPGMEVAVAETPTNGGPAPVELPTDWGTVLPVADVAAGEKVAQQKCASCHDFANGGPNKIGPNLYGVVGGKHAHQPTFAYSAAMKGLAAEDWTYVALEKFVKDPKAAIPGTKMTFAGLSKPQDRINLIAYLRGLSASPIAIPAPNPVAPPAPAAPADGAAEPPAGELQAPPPGSASETAAPGTPAPAAPGTAGPATPPAAAPGTTPAKPPAH
jgi:cytochrome c